MCLFCCLAFSASGANRPLVPWIRLHDEIDLQPTAPYNPIATDYP